MARRSCRFRCMSRVAAHPHGIGGRTAMTRYGSKHRIRYGRVCNVSICGCRNSIPSRAGCMRMPGGVCSYRFVFACHDSRSPLLSGHPGQHVVSEGESIWRTVSDNNF